MPSALFVDANLIVLLVVGLVGRDLIARHRRTRTFDVDDFERLTRAISRVGSVRVTPNTLTEASNLLGQHGEPQRSRLLLKLRALIEQSPEIVVASVDAARHDVFPRLGLTDAALLEVVSADAPLLTVDLNLYVAALAGGDEAAINFNHSGAGEGWTRRARHYVFGASACSAAAGASTVYTPRHRREQERIHGHECAAGSFS